MVGRALSYVRQHHVALLALFVGLGGTSYAVAFVPRANHANFAKSAKNSQMVDRLHARSYPEPGTLLALDGQGKFPASVFPLLPSGPKGDKGDPGEKGDPGPPGPAGSAGTALGFAHVHSDGTLDAVRSHGVVGVRRGGAGESSPFPHVTCFDLTFTPRNVVVSFATEAFIRAARDYVITGAAGDPGELCLAPFEDASVAILEYQHEGALGFEGQLPFYALFN